MGATSIEWSDAVWNPVRGCVKVSPGCKNCYAETFAERWRGIPGHPTMWRIRLKSKKGGDMAEWPADLRVREFPEVRA